MLPDDLQKLWLLYENCLKARCLDEKLQEVYHSKFPNAEKMRGIVPVNNYTPNHVKKFREALEDIGDKNAR